MANEICVVILHYNNAQMTQDYITNLKNLNWQNISHHFVIVDNLSPDGSGKILSKVYQTEDEIVVILADKNSGFAKGNNLGICYAKKNYNADLIIVSNNDIKIEDRDFPKKLWDLYVQENFAVYGPDIYSLSKQIHQSPIRKTCMTPDNVQSKIDTIERQLRKLYLLKKLHIYELLSQIKRALGKHPGTIGINYKNRQSNVVIHGAFFVLSNIYMQSFPDGLYDQTFMYMEEDILAYQCRQKTLKIYYDPKLMVLHYDGVSTLAQIGTKIDKYIFELEQTKESCITMLCLMQDNKYSQ